MRPRFWVWQSVVSLISARRDWPNETALPTEVGVPDRARNAGFSRQNLPNHGASGDVP